MECSVTHHLAKHTALWISSHFPPKFLDTHRPFWKIINDLSKFQLYPVQLLVWPLITHIQSFRTVKTHTEIPSKLPELHRHTHGLWGPFGVLQVQNNKCLWSAYCVPGTIPVVALGTQRWIRHTPCSQGAHSLTRGAHKEVQYMW